MGEISMATHWDQMNRLLLVFFLTICFATSAKATEGGLPSVAGTYEILICRGLCASSDSINVEVRGHVKRSIT